MSPLVRLGTETGSKVVKVAMFTFYSLLLVLGLCKALRLTCIFLCALTLPIGKLVVNYVEQNHKDLDAVKVLIQGLVLFQGGMLMLSVSHDGHLISGSVEQLWE
ncbi:hypothetical protein LOK49_LG10G02630, partial [Camellia lanceoleosa]